MPTATSTITTTVYSKQKPLKSTMKAVMSVPNSPTASTAATLRGLYNRAARAFLHRDIALTFSLIETAFELVKAPALVHDALAEHRRKWDILRITLETTIYADPPAMDSIPRTLQSNITESPHTLMSNIYKRSLELFTPTSGPSDKLATDPAFLPSSVLITMLYSSLKVDSADIGRMMAEQWLSRRESPLLLNPTNSEETEDDGYDKVVEIYSLHILPKLEQWVYAKEFLQFEGELQQHRRELFKSRLNALHAETLASWKPASPPSPSPTPPFRSHSPTPSSSSSSSLSTTSTHTIVPPTPRRARAASKLQTITPIDSEVPSSKTSSEGTATPRGRPVETANGDARPRSQTRATASSITSSSSAISAAPRANLQTSSLPTTAPTLLSLIKTSLMPHLTTSKITTFFILFVLFPLVSWVFRIRSRRRKIATTPYLSNSPSNVDLVRRRLHAAGSNDANIITRLWRETLSAVVDTVKMAGSGLV
ncbi:hypothetical protein FA15DRAFT_599241 [Coprinopsis marcescibilis]|uniref:Uncharacterized protein n=1 Tax=Coprinopsis marcescibilis TaxID=230819 RepID=A0A5C3KXQ4_COPMA|nr:hypothetical protein FA15DRAFT_599241 [Coprinopsis marcescibilis]